MGLFDASELQHNSSFCVTVVCRPQSDFAHCRILITHFLSLSLKLVLGWPDGKCDVQLIGDCGKVEVKVKKKEEICVSL